MHLLKHFHLLKKTQRIFSSRGDQRFVRRKKCRTGHIVFHCTFSVDHEWARTSLKNFPLPPNLWNGGSNLLNNEVYLRTTVRLVLGFSYSLSLGIFYFDFSSFVFVLFLFLSSFFLVLLYFLFFSSTFFLFLFSVSASPPPLPPFFSCSSSSILLRCLPFSFFLFLFHLLFPFLISLLHLFI